MRVIAIDTAARNAIRMSRSYGSPDTVYLFPSNAVPSSRSSKKRGSALMTRDGDAPSGKGTIAVRTSLDVPLVAATRVCCSCGNPAHTLNDCPALYFTDTNNDHSCNWADSIVGKAWLANSETCSYALIHMRTAVYKLQTIFQSSDCCPHLQSVRLLSDFSHKLI